MSPLELYAYQIVWAAKDAAFNLDFIPEDRLAWKPHPVAKSALEMVNEMVGSVKGMTAAFRDGSWTFAYPPPQFTPATTVDEAKTLLVDTAEEYARVLDAIQGEALDRPVDLGFAKLPLLKAAGLPVIEMIHHRGQIIYIQSLLGDAEMHFDMTAL